MHCMATLLQEAAQEANMCATSFFGHGHPFFQLRLLCMLINICVCLTPIKRESHCSSYSLMRASRIDWYPI